MCRGSIKKRLMFDFEWMGVCFKSICCCCVERKKCLCYYYYSLMCLLVGCFDDRVPACFASSVHIRNDYGGGKSATKFQVFFISTSLQNSYLPRHLPPRYITR